MIIEKRWDHLSVLSYIHFDEKDIFCGRPYIYLIAFNEPAFCWDANTISIAVHDDDDFDIGLVYKTNAENFENVLHELINWMRDHEQGISYYEKLNNPFDFFPDCNCERERW